MRALAITLMCLGLACSVEEELEELELDPDPISVLEPSALAPVEAEHDPLAAHRPTLVDCPPGAWGPEGGGFEIQTGVCNYAAFDQALPMPAQAGDLVEVLVWHDFLDAAQPGTGHFAVWLGEEVIWEAEVDIPAPSGLLEAVIPLEHTPAPDARLGFHLHNHGFNSWRVLEVGLQQL